MNQVLLAAALVTWIGATLVLADLRWFARRPLVERLRPHLSSGTTPAARPSLSVETFREVIAPLATSLGAAVARLLGVQGDLGTRLARAHSPLDATAARVHQFGWVVGGFATGASAALGLDLPIGLGLLAVFGLPAAAFLVIERRHSMAAEDWQRRLFLELPVVSEQIGMLLTSGYSLGAALDRIATRGSGAVARDLEQVGRRVRQGLALSAALREWAELADVPAVDRLVSVLALDRATGDLGQLISAEARAARRAVQRDLAAAIERREQQVWIPVTVATLVPGTIFVAVPFLQTMRLFAGS